MPKARDANFDCLRYLCVEPFLSNALTARALQHALEVGMIDRLLHSSLHYSELAANESMDELGVKLLIQLLQKNNVVTDSDDRVTLTEEFRAASEFRDLMLARLRFSNHVVEDYFVNLPHLLHSSGQFQRHARLFEVFDYSRCLEVTNDNCQHAAQWMQLTTAFSKYEGPVCCQLYDFSSHKRLLDIGGNSGEFAAQICLQHPHLQAIVLDLPVVCHVGQHHLRSQHSAASVSFMPGDARRIPLPEDCDIITWKSVLHDWPDDDVQHFLARTYAALPTGGTLLIFERTRRKSWPTNVTYGTLPTQLFLRSYRDPSCYLSWLRKAGFQKITQQDINLDMPFTLFTAKKP